MYNTLHRVNDRILSANGVSFESIDYSSAVDIIKNAEQINMADFGIVLGCKFYIKEIRNTKLAEKDPGLKEGDSVLRINGQSVEGSTLDEVNKWLERSREKLCLVIQRDVRRGTSRWPSQNTVYERVGSVSATPRQSPSPMLTHQPLSNSPAVSGSGLGGGSQGSGGQMIPLTGEYEYYNRQQPKPEQNGLRAVTFRKVGGSVGVRVIGGNEVGIFVSAVAADSPAALHGVCCGDRIVEVNSRQMRGVSRESAVQLLLALDDRVTLRLEHARQEFEHVRNNQMGDNFYIRTHFSKDKKASPLELSIGEGDIFHITDTLFGGTVGLWQAARVYSANSNKGEPTKGVIPNQSTAESMAREQRRSNESKGRGTLLRRKLESRRTKSLPKNLLTDPAELSASIPLPAYERVALNTPSFHRPLVLFGPLADVARSQLLSQFSMRFAEPEGDGGIIRLSAVDSVISAGKHCILDISVESVERLQLAQYAPIVVLIDVDGRSRIRELRKKVGFTNLGLIVLLFPLSSKIANYDSDMESLKGDYGDYSLKREESINHGTSQQPMARSIYDWDPSRPSPSDPAHPSETRVLQNGWVTLPRRHPGTSLEHTNNSQPIDHITVKSHRGLTASELRSNTNDNFELPSRKSSETSSNILGLVVNDVRTGLNATNGHGCLNTNRLKHNNTSTSNPLISISKSINNDATPITTINPTSPNRKSKANEFGVYFANLIIFLDHLKVFPFPLFKNFVFTSEPSASPGRQLNSPGYYHVKQLLKDDSLYHDARLANEIANVRLREEARIREERVREEQRIQNLQQGNQLPLQPPNPDMYSPREERVTSCNYYTPSGLYGSSHQSRCDAVSTRPTTTRCSQSAQPRPSIPPKPNLYADSNIRNRWHDSNTPEPLSRMDSPSITSNSISISQAQSTTFSQHQHNGNGCLNNKTSSGGNAILNGERDISLNPNTNSSEASRRLEQAAEKSVSQQDEQRSVNNSGKIDEINREEGAVLNCPVSGVELRIPKGAIPEGEMHEIYVKVCREGDSPPIDKSKGETLLSPLVMCGPQGLNFLTPCELRLPHCGPVDTDGQWSFSLKAGECGQWKHMELDLTETQSDRKFLSVPITHF
uniref:PDZ domain-containing protein n=1 Tax=Heterorhabditis bacteriophora TaxID=37862 RepID=A0A1I7XGY9_HETBA